MGFCISKDETQFIKGIAIICVILSHMDLFECGGAIGVHLFLIVSGYGIYCSYERNKEKYWRRRILAVYVPYLFSSIILDSVRYIVLNNQYISFKNIIISIIGLDFGLNIDPTMWYISYIFVYYFIAFCVMKIKSYSVYVAIIIGMFLIIIVTACGYKHIIWHQGTNVWAYGVLFPFGMLVAKIRKNKKFSIFMKDSILLISAISVIVLLRKSHDSWIKMIFTFSMAFLILIFSVIIFKCKKRLLEKCIQIIVSIGKNSYFMYLNEALIIGIVSKMLIRIQGMNVFKAIVVIGISYMTAVLFNKLYKKYIFNVVRNV